MVVGRELMWKVADDWGDGFDPIADKERVVMLVNMEDYDQLSSMQQYRADYIAVWGGPIIKSSVGRLDSSR